MYQSYFLPGNVWVTCHAACVAYHSCQRVSFPCVRQIFTQDACTPAAVIFRTVSSFLEKRLLPYALNFYELVETVQDTCYETAWPRLVFLLERGSAIH